MAPSVIKIEVQQAPCRHGYSPPSISQSTLRTDTPKLIDPRSLRSNGPTRATLACLISSQNVICWSTPTSTNGVSRQFHRLEVVGHDEVTVDLIAVDYPRRSADVRTPITARASPHIRMLRRLGIGSQITHVHTHNRPCSKVLRRHSGHGTTTFLALFPAGEKKSAGAVPKSSRRASSYVWTRP